MMAERLRIDEVHVFDGRHPEWSPLSDVVVSDGRISGVFPAGSHPAEAGTEVLAGGGRRLLPGLIDAHWHASFTSIPVLTGLIADPGYLHVVASRDAGRTLDRGFTTVRDCGGPTFGLKRAIDEGVVPGPRIFPSGAFITQTSGHGDFRIPAHDFPRSCDHLHHTERTGASYIADGVSEVLRGVREQLMRGASQIKIMAGGGVSSFYDPIDVTQYTEAEMRAAVEAAENWGTYVMAHAYTPRAIQQAIRAGIRSIEHGHLVDDETVAMMAEHDVWWSMQPFLDDEDAIPLPDPRARAKQLEIIDGTDRAYELARKHGVKLAWGTDTLFDAKLADRQGAQLAKMTRWFTPGEVLVMATSTNAELCALSGPRNPYPGLLGVIEPGAHADLLVTNGDPLVDLTVVADPANLTTIVKGGAIHRNTLTATTT